MPGAFVRDIAYIVEIQTLRLPERFVQIVIADESTLASALGLRTGLVPVSPAKLGFQQ
jgi:hypothetical protein